MPISELLARLGGWPRKVLALCCLLLAAVTAIAARPAGSPAPRRPVVVAAHDLAAGTQLGAADLQVRSWPADIRPPNVISSPAAAVGHRLTMAMRHDEPLTTTRLSGADLTVGLSPNLQAIPVRVTGATAGLLHVGESIDLLLAGSAEPAAASVEPTAQPPPATVLAEEVTVLDVHADSPVPGDDTTTQLIVAADRATALRIAAAAGRTVLATVRNRS